MRHRFSAPILLTLALAATTTAAEPETLTVTRPFNNRPFSCRVELRSEAAAYRLYRLAYPSPVVTSVESNNTVPVDYYLPTGIGPGSAKRPAVICLHILHGNFELEHIACSVLATRGIPAALMKLPYYGERSPAGGQEMLAANPKRLVEALGQGIQDVRRLVDVLSARPEVDPQRVGIMGISLGGIVAATAAGSEPRLWRSVLIHSGGDVPAILHHARETRRLSDLIQGLPAGERAAVDEALAAVDPLQHAGGLRERAAAGRVLMINAGADEVIPRDCTEKLADALGLSQQVVWLDGLGHYSAIAALPQTLRATADFFAHDLPSDVKPPEAPRPASGPTQAVIALAQQISEALTSQPAAGRCHLVDLAASLTLKDGQQYRGQLRLVRGTGGRFALRFEVPQFGTVALGQDTSPWLASKAEAVFCGELPPGTPPSDPLLYADQVNLDKLGALAGMAATAALVPDTLQRVLAITDETRPNGPRTVSIARSDHARDSVRLVLAEDQRTPALVDFQVDGVRGEIMVRAWQLNGIADDSLFEPPAGRKRQPVEAADLYRMFAAAFNFALESLEVGPRRGPQADESAALEVVTRDSAGHGLLCRSQGKRVLFVSGTPEQMGAAQGLLLAGPCRKLMERILYLVGAADSVESGTWFMDRMAEVQRRTEPHVPRRFQVECDALARAAGISARDGRYGNLFPERFHCSGVAVRGRASTDGRVLHARVLDYMRDIRLQDEAVVTVFLPEGHSAWISHGYSGFIGTVTAMNEHGLAIGEMGGRGEGDWDGTPMSLLLRDIMERARTVEEGLDILRRTPRTCQYYYVLSDKSRAMAAVESDAHQITVLRPGQQDSRLPKVPDDTVLISAGDRAQVLSQRLQAAYGRIDVPTLIEIIKRPVAMRSNLHNAVFSPETLEIWVSDAGPHSAACDEPYARFDLKQLLEFYRAGGK